MKCKICYGNMTLKNFTNYKGHCYTCYMNSKIKNVSKKDFKSIKQAEEYNDLQNYDKYSNLKN